MKFHFLLEDYNLFYSRCYEKNPGLSTISYAAQLKFLISKHYYQSDSLGISLQNLGHSVYYSIPHCKPVQESWAKENTPSLYYKWKASKPLHSLKARVLGNFDAGNSLLQETIIEQVKETRPDVIFVFSGVWLDKSTIELFGKMGIKTILYWSCPISGKWKNFSFQSFDAIASSAESKRKEFKAAGLKNFEFQQAFDKRLLTDPGALRNSGEVVFVGSITEAHHSNRIQVVNEILEKRSIDIFCPPLEGRKGMDKINAHRRGHVSGKEMMDVYQGYKIAIHIPGDDFTEDTGAKRIFEVTGSGTLLLALHQPEMEKYFIPGKEIITFRDSQDAVEKIQYFLSHEEERKEVALRGMRKTLEHHSFEKRAVQLLDEIKNIKQE